jgi:hypothetical protein
MSLALCAVSAQTPSGGVVGNGDQKSEGITDHLRPGQAESGSAQAHRRVAGRRH